MFVFFLNFLKIVEKEIGRKFVGESGEIMVTLNGLKAQGNLMREE